MTQTQDNFDNVEIYVYSWHVDHEEKNDTFIRVYGLDEHNNNVCVAINGFRPYVYVELPNHIDWNLHKHQLYTFFDNLVRGNPNFKRHLMFKRKLYGANLVERNGCYQHKKFPFLKCSFSSKRDAYYLGCALKKRQTIYGVGTGLQFFVHEQDACPRLQLTSMYDLPTAGWIAFKGLRVSHCEDRFTEGCVEYLVDLSDERHCNATKLKKSERVASAKPMILSFDLEVNSEDGVTMPKATRPGDAVFQISCVLSRLGSPVRRCDKYLLSLGNPSEDVVGATVRSFPTEAKLLLGFRDFVKEFNPNCIIGYNIFGFDIPYLIDRTHYKSIYPEWSIQGFPRDRAGIDREIKWTSSAYKNQEFRFLECEGRLYIDLLPVIQRDFKLDNYKLKTVSTHFLKETKDDLDAKGIFKCYREGIKDTPLAAKYMSVCGKYCMQDSILVTKLFEKLQLWFGLTEMATISNVPMITLFTKGQQIKVYSTLYKFCLAENIVVISDGYVSKLNERYVGAHVFPPVPGLYESVVPYDFSSLYPSTIIAYNIDYSTFVSDPHIPDDMCHVMEWEDHVGCKHDPKVIKKAKLTKTIETCKDSERLRRLRKERKDVGDIAKGEKVMCERRKYRFLKAGENNSYIGVLPSVIKYLLDARKKTREQIKTLQQNLKSLTESESNDAQGIAVTISILNQRQLAYKVSANSMYGITGVKAGMLPFMPAAMTITYMGRTNIIKAADIIQKTYGGHLVYGDTDSNYVTYAHMQGRSPEELWDYAVKTADEISAQFPDPIKLEFEEAIYTKFLILTKKRYLYRASSRSGEEKKSIGSKGVVSNRRDNSIFIRQMYEDVIACIFENDSFNNIQTKVFSTIRNKIDQMFSNKLPVEHFVITKTAGDYGDLKPSSPFVDEKGVEKVMLGQYKSKILSDELRIAEEISTSEQERAWYLSKLPAHIQLLEKIKQRGQTKNEGSRLEYVIIETNNLDDKQSRKIESFDYFLKHRDVIRLDYLYYMERCINAIDQVMEVVFGVYDFLKTEHKTRVAVNKLSRLSQSFVIFDSHSCLVKVGENKYKILGQLDPTLHSSTYTIVATAEAPALRMYVFMERRYGIRSTLKTRFLFCEGGIIDPVDFSERKLINEFIKCAYAICSK